jgi:hypothetical protein
LLVRVTLNNREDDHKRLNVPKKLLTKAKEEVEDIQVKLKAVANERQELTAEYYKATLRGTPDEMEKAAADFNNILDDGLILLAQMEKIHQKLLTLEANFLNLQKDRTDAVSRLGQMAPLSLTESLGRLALVEPPYGYVFRVGEEMTDFVGNLKGYQRKLQGYQDFGRANTDPVA